MNAFGPANDSPAPVDIDLELQIDSPHVVRTKYWHRLDDKRFVFLRSR